MREPRGRLAQKRERVAEFRRRYHEQRKNGEAGEKDFEEKPRIKHESKIKKQYKEYFASLVEERLKKGKLKEQEGGDESVSTVDKKIKTVKREGVIVTGAAHSKSGVIRPTSTKKVQEQETDMLEDENQKKLSEDKSVSKNSDTEYRVPKDTSMLDNVR